MKALLLLSLLAAAGPDQSAEPGPEASIVIEPREWDFGELYPGARVEHAFGLTNRGPRPVTIRGLEPDPGTPLAFPIVLAPGQSRSIPIAATIPFGLGRTSLGYRVLSDDPGRGGRKLRITGFVESAYDPPFRDLDFGDVDRSAGKTLEFDLASREVAPFEVTGSEGLAPGMAVEAVRVTDPGENAVRVRVRLAPGTPQGVLGGSFDLLTNAAHQPRYPVRYLGNVFGDVVPSQSPVYFGAVRVGETSEHVVRLQSRSGRDFEIERVEAPGSPLTVLAGPCPGISTGCRALTLRAQADEKTNLAGLLRIFLAGSDEPVPLAYSGVVLPAGARITDVDLGASPPPPPPGPRPSPALAPAAAQPAAAPPPVTLAWQARAEDTTYGYIVYRALRREGPYLRLNARILRVQETPGPHRYSFVDENVEPGQTYHYYLETVSIRGVKEQLTPVVSRQVAGAAR